MLQSMYTYTTVFLSGKFAGGGAKVGQVKGGGGGGGGGAKTSH